MNIVLDLKYKVKGKAVIIRKAEKERLQREAEKKRVEQERKQKRLGDAIDPASDQEDEPP